MKRNRVKKGGGVKIPEKEMDGKGGRRRNSEGRRDQLITAVIWFLFR